MKKYEAGEFRSEVAWRGPNLARLKDATVKLRWTDRPFRWHTNKGQEIFAVLSGQVDMHVRPAYRGTEEVIRLRAGDLLHIEEGEEHVAHPLGEARILVIEEAEQ